MWADGKCSPNRRPSSSSRLTTARRSLEDGQYAEHRENGVNLEDGHSNGDRSSPVGREYKHQQPLLGGGIGYEEGLGLALGPEFAAAPADGWEEVSDRGVWCNFGSSGASMQDSDSCYSRVQGSAVEQQLLGVVEGALKGEGSCVWGLLSGLRTHFPHAGSAARARQQERRRQQEELEEGWCQEQGLEGDEQQELVVLAAEGRRLTDKQKKGVDLGLGCKWQGRGQQQQQGMKEVSQHVAKEMAVGVGRTMAVLQTEEQQPARIPGVSSGKAGGRSGTGAAMGVAAAAKAAGETKGNRGRGSRGVSSDKHRLRSRTPPCSRLVNGVTSEAALRDQKGVFAGGRTRRPAMQGNVEKAPGVKHQQKEEDGEEGQQQWLQQQQEHFGSEGTLGMMQRGQTIEARGGDKAYACVAGKRKGNGQGSRSRVLVLGEEQEEQLAR
jgi:hypothetical protein